MNKGLVHVSPTIMRALVIGATGFVGANLVQVLGEAGWQVRAMVRRTSTLSALRGLAYEPVWGDVTDPAGLPPAMEGCDGVFHVAAAVADYWQQDLGRLYRVNVDGTRHVLEAAMAAGVPRLVFTSSQAALGLTDGPMPMDESHRFNIPPGTYPYGHSKMLAEQEVMAAVQRGLKAIIVNPTVVMGRRDTYLQNSRIILEVAQGRIPLVPPGGINVVDATDLAWGHLRAFEKGRPGERYLLAGHNVSNVALASAIAEVLGVRPPRGVIPRALIAPAARVLDGANRVSPRRLPLSGDLLRMGARSLYADNSKAVQELGFSVTPLPATIESAVDWLRAEGHLA